MRGGGGGLGGGLRAAGDVFFQNPLCNSSGVPETAMPLFEGEQCNCGYLSHGEDRNLEAEKKQNLLL